MKRQTYTHPKLYDLADRLAVTIPTAIGHLELLLDFAADHAPDGIIGKWTPAAIARAAQWTGQPAAFVEALEAAGWLDRTADGRLAVHDITDHAPNWWKAANAKNGIQFWDQTAAETPAAKNQAPADPPAPPPTTTTAIGWQPDQEPLKPLENRANISEASKTTLRAFLDASTNQTKPNLTIPNRTGPDRTGPEGARAASPPKTTGMARPGPTFKNLDFEGWPELADLTDYPLPIKPAGALRRRGMFAPIKSADLAKPAIIAEWHARQADMPEPILPPTAAGLAIALAVARFALSKPLDQITKSRAALFAAILGRRRWQIARHLIPEAIEDLPPDHRPRPPLITDDTEDNTQCRCTAATA